MLLKILSLKLWLTLSTLIIINLSSLLIRSYLNPISILLRTISKVSILLNLKILWPSHLPQSKSYLKIIDISYIMENINILVNSSIIKSIIKSTYIFNNILLTFKLRVIKALSKSNMTIIWIDIWDIQSSIKAKGFINRCFNVSNYIATIHEPRSLLMQKLLEIGTYYFCILLLRIKIHQIQQTP